jgi:ATP-dependent exoDNAse (exonuclease V) beta subunit
MFHSATSLGPTRRSPASIRNGNFTNRLAERIEAVGDDADLQEVYDTERHLLYVACTRARDHLLVTGVSPVSEFLDDLTEAGMGTGVHEGV